MGVVMSLTNKQKAFIERYLANGFNATEAAKYAGYSENNAKEQGYENLTKPHIKKHIDKRMQELAMGADEVLIRLAQTARFDPSDFIEGFGMLTYIDIDRLKAAGLGHMIKGLKSNGKTTDVILKDPDKALEQIGKILNLTNRQNVEGEISININYADD